MRISDWSSDVCSSDLALKLKIVDEVVPAAELIPHTKAWLATNPDPVKPWDKKGFALPESRGLLNPEAAAMFSRSEEHPSELQSLMRLSYAVFCLTKKIYNSYNPD